MNSYDKHTGTEVRITMLVHDELGNAYSMVLKAFVEKKTAYIVKILLLVPESDTIGIKEMRKYNYYEEGCYVTDLVLYQFNITRNVVDFYFTYKIIEKFILLRIKYGNVVTENSLLALSSLEEDIKEFEKATEKIHTMIFDNWKGRKNCFIR